MKKYIHTSPHTHYIFQTELDRGEYGKLVLVSSSLIDGDYAVMKIVELNPNKNKFDITNEGDILKTLDHENVIKLHDSFITYNRSHYCIVMEYAERGNIR